MGPVKEYKNSDPEYLEEKLNSNIDHNIWSNLLTQVQASSPNKLPSGKLLLVLGDEGSGKTSLIARIQGNRDAKKGSGLEFNCVVVQDDYRDDHTRLGVWILDGDPWQRNLLKFALNERTFPHTVVLFTVAMTQPWKMMESLQNWADILEEHIRRLKFDPGQLEECKEKVKKRFNGYLEPGAELEGFSIFGRTRNETLVAPFALDEHTLTCNLGLDLVVVVTKTDFISTLEKEFDYKEEHFDFIQQAGRKFCLKYGASLFYTSVKEDKNCDLLYKYLVHRIYGFPFRTPALVVEKDAIFIPSGWDSEKKISILYESLTSVDPDDNFSDIIIKPIVRKPFHREIEVVAEEDQLFLVKQQATLSQQSVHTSRNQETPVKTLAAMQKSAERRFSSSAGIPISPKKVDGSKGVAGSEGVLQNFFSSLLNRKTGSSPGTTSSFRPTDDGTE
ncbi:cytoplasmic dynein 1 light intermediate chain 2-like isoform X2 [Tachypleus tridentatus]|uniref:cytoplasmic dynein 1 light intermediate chain 2-like isoform X2 n=1 Tax=Tachypleus tridentatus TaxID=6853 RepID=UPI003FD354FB